eukprot:6213866-Pleurochrysis_carterae.AAC.1
MSIVTGLPIAEAAVSAEREAGRMLLPSCSAMSSVERLRRGQSIRAGSRARASMPRSPIICSTSCEWNGAVWSQALSVLVD